MSLRIVLMAMTAMVAAIVQTPATISADDVQSRKVIVVVGAPGLDEYRTMFNEWSACWEDVADKSNIECVVIGKSSGSGDREKLQQQLTECRESGVNELWLVFIGHGTFDGQSAKFNLRGPDISARELATWIEGAANRAVVINGASASGPFINELTGPNTIVVTATNSGYEFNFCRFGQFIAESIGAGGIDLDKDQQISLLEAFIAASAQTAEYYESRSRLATEHALIDDNGDGRGTPGDWFRGTRVVKTAKDGSAADGLRANQVFFYRNPHAVALVGPAREQRDQLELSLERLRQQKDSMTEDQYMMRLEPIIVQLAELYREAKKADASSDKHETKNDDADADKVTDEDRN